MYITVREAIEKHGITYHILQKWIKHGFVESKIGQRKTRVHTHYCGHTPHQYTLTLVNEEHIVKHQRRKRNPPPKEWMMKQMAAGLSQAMMGTNWGVSLRTMAKWLRKEGVTRTPSEASRLGKAQSAHPAKRRRGIFLDTLKWVDSLTVYPSLKKIETKMVLGYFGVKDIKGMIETRPYRGLEVL